MYLEERMTALEQKVDFLAQQAIPTERWLTAEELSKEMRISRTTIYRRIKDGSIKTANIFGAVRIPMSQFYE